MRPERRESEHAFRARAIQNGEEFGRIKVIGAEHFYRALGSRLRRERLELHQSQIDLGTIRQRGARRLPTVRVGDVHLVDAEDGVDKSVVERGIARGHLPMRLRKLLLDIIGVPRAAASGTRQPAATLRRKCPEHRPVGRWSRPPSRGTCRPRPWHCSTATASSSVHSHRSAACAREATNRACSARATRGASRDPKRAPTASARHVEWLHCC
eukprot:scaffold17839_cov120-Isochrysis_galbana.AAC.3